MQAPLGNRYNQYGFSKSTTKQPVYNSQEAYHAQQISERPGRGVFTDTGQRVHRGQPLISSPQRPPRLPARNPQNMAPNKNLGSRSPERIKLPSKRDDKVLHDGDFKDIHLSRINANEVNKQPDYPRELHRSTVIGNLPDSDTFLNQAPKANLKHSQSVVQPSKTDQKPKISRSATIAGKSSYPNMIRQVSNKYQMLICPDFFPISKLNHPHRQNKRKPTIERDADKTGYRPNATMADDGFYRSHWGDMIPRELRTPFDQDFVEDPIEQTLYPSMIARDGQLSSLLHQHLYTSHREHPSITNQSFVDPTKPLISGNSEISPALSTSFDSGHTSTVSSSYQEILPVWYKMQSHQQREHEQRTENATIYPSSYQRNFKQVEDKTPAHHTDNFDEVLHSNSHVYENIRNQRINVQDSVRGYQFEPIAESTATHHKKKENYNKIFTTYSTYEGNQIEMSEALMVGNREDGKATLKLQQIAKPTMESKVRFLNQDEKHREYMKMQDHLATSQQYTPRIGAYQESHCVKVNTTTVSVSSLQQNSQVSPLPGAEVEPSRLQSSSHTSRNQMNDRNFIPIESSTHGTIALPKPMKSNKSLNSNLHLFTGDLVCKSNSKIQTHSRQHNAVPEKLKNYQRTLQSGVDIKTKEPFQSSASPSSPPTPEVDLLVLPKPKLLSDNMDNSHSLHVLPPAEDDPVVISSYLEVIRDSGADDSSHLSLNPAHILSQDEKQPPSTTNKLRLHDAKAHSSPRENGLITQADNSHLAQSERDLYVSVQSEAALAHDGNHDAVADVDNSSEDISGGEERDKLETEMNQLMDHLATVNGGLSEGLGEDILSITKMWKNLPSNDSWTAKRKALLDDPLMTAITHKMKALLEEATKEQISNKNMQKKSIIVTSEPVPSNFQEEFYNTTKLPNGGNLVIREPAEGSSDDPNESADLRSKRNRNSENSQPTKLGSYSKLNNLPMNVAHNGHSHSKLNQSNNLDSKLVSLNIRNKLSSDRWNEEPQYPIPSQVQGENDTEEDMIESEYVTQTKHVKLVDPGEENIFKMIRKKSSDKKRVSKSRSPRNLTILTQLSESDDSDMVEDDDIIADGNNQEGSDGSENVNEADHQYLSDFLRHKSKRKRHKPSLKKISFSKDSSKAKAGDIIGPASQSSLHSRVSDESNSLPSNKSEKALLSVNPFMNNKNNNSIENLDLPAPLITSPTSSVSDAENNLKLKSRPGILKRSEETEGSQLSLGTCSAFGSHVSLDSEVSRAGSFPLLTLSDGSKKDFKIVFDDVDVNDMGNLFKVSRKARSEGAASEPESTDESDDGATLISCKACHTRKPLFKARLVFKMCHGCYTYYCSSECRRRDWPAHKPLCIVSRLSSLARKIFKRVASDDELLHHCSRFARTGYLCEGRGAVVLSFSSPRKAQLFLSNAKQAKESALYLSIKDLQQFTFDDKRDKEQLLANCRHYNPDEKFILHLAIKMNKKYSSQPVEPRIKGREFHKWARIRLIEYLPSPKRECVDDEETLILTAMTEPYDQLAQEAPDQKTREIFFANVLTKLRKRGISLRHQYPDVYSALCQYVTSGKVFAPISLFAFNLHTQKRFMCCILPYSDPDVSWENNPHLLEDLNLAVAL